MPSAQRHKFKRQGNALVPADAEAERFLSKLRGFQMVQVAGGVGNQRRRGKFRKIADLAALRINEIHGLTLSGNDLIDITKDKLGMYKDIPLPSGDIHRTRTSTSNRNMNEADRSKFTDDCFRLWSTWIGFDVNLLLTEDGGA